MPRCSSGLVLALHRCSWFILKDGKIFWFKTDIVGPVSSAGEQPTWLCTRQGHNQAS